MYYLCNKCGWEFLFSRDKDGKPKCPRCGNKDDIKEVER